GGGDELQGIKRGLLELVDLIAVNKADGPTQAAAELAARQYESALQMLAVRHDAPVNVLTCSALHQRGVDAVWNAMETQHTQRAAKGELGEGGKRQSLRWLGALVEEVLRQALYDPPEVRAIREDRERELLAGPSPAVVAARRILQAFSSRPG